MKPQIWLGIIVVILFWLFFMKVFQSAEKSVLINEGFVVPANTLQDGQQRFNDLTNLINLTNPQLDLNSSNQNLVTRATNTPNFNLPATGGIPGSFVQSSVTSPYMIPSGQPDTIRIANDICEKVKSSDCTAFQNPEFAKYCGISFDLNGINSKGEKHVGGLFISSDDRDEQLKQAKKMGLSENDVRFTPSIGTAKKGLFTIDAGSCKVVSEQLACKNKKVFESADAPNCTQCFTSGEFNRVNPKTPRIPPRFVIQTNADYMQVIIPGGRSISPPVQKDTPMTLPMQINEGEVIFFDISGDPASTYFCGYLSADTINGPFNMDLKQLIDLDSITNYKPRLGGSKTINQVRCITMRPGTGNNRMNLRMMLPFSFLSPNDYDAGTCENGPIISKKSGADYLQSDVCYGKNNKPGSYSLDCLQQMFVSMGGTTEGKGYPSDANKANTLMFQNGKPLELNEIANYLYDMNVRASTGKDSQGKSLSIEDWSKASEFITGQTISSPCDTPTKDTGPLSQECLEYLYYNKGATNPRVGPTYTIGGGYASRDKDGNAIYCRPEGTANPKRPEMFKQLSKVGNGIAAVKSFFNKINLLANDNTLPNESRKEFIKYCYGDTLRRANSEVFWVGPGYDYRKDEAEAVCKRYGAIPATYAEVDMAQKAGADWCATGWVADGPTFNTNVYFYGPWLSQQNKLAQVRKLNNNTNVYLVEDDIYTKMVSDNLEEKYYRGTISQFNPSNWDSYSRTPGQKYLIKKDSSNATGSVPYYPITTRTMGGCGNGSPGMKAYLPPSNKAGVHCMGPKPEKGTPQAAGIAPFNEKLWNAPS